MLNLSKTLLKKPHYEVGDLENPQEDNNLPSRNKENSRAEVDENENVQENSLNKRKYFNRIKRKYLIQL